MEIKVKTNFIKKAKDLLPGDKFNPKLSGRKILTVRRIDIFIDQGSGFQNFLVEEKTKLGTITKGANLEKASSLANHVMIFTEEEGCRQFVLQQDRDVKYFGDPS